MGGGHTALHRSKGQVAKEFTEDGILNNPLPVSKQLPFDLRSALVRAAAIENPFERRRAIERAEEKARAQFPQLFRKPTE
jgi:hypothetical protein